MDGYPDSTDNIGQGPVQSPFDLDLDALEREARMVLGEMAYAYYSGGAGDERLVRENISAWNDWNLLPRVLNDVSNISTKTSAMGSEIATPLIIAPTALHGLAHPDGECASARASAKSGTIFTLSSLSNQALEDVAASAKGAAQWMQIYILKDRGQTKDTLERVAAAGYSAIVLTVDAPVSGLRSGEIRRGVTLPQDLHLPNLAHAAHAKNSTEGFMAAVAKEFDPALSVDDITWLAELSKLPVIVKGVARSDDALRALDAGAQGIVVSNHGGRQLDEGIATARLLTDVVTAVDGRAEIFVDGGIRRPSDVLKALALGARAVLIGRPVLWALATGGEEGVSKLLEFFSLELRRTMALCGVNSIAQIDHSLIRSALQR